MDKLEARKITAMLLAAYPHWSPSEQTQELYEQFLLPLPAEAAKEATMRIIQSRREFAPPVGVIINEATEGALTKAGISHLSAEEAWGIVMEQIHYRGVYRLPDLDKYPAIKHAIKALDWVDVCTNENIEATRAHFMRIFNAYQNREVRNALDNLSAGREVLQGQDMPLVNGFVAKILRGN